MLLHRLVLVTLAMFLAACEENQKSVTLSTPNGEVSYQERVLPQEERYEDVVSDLTEAERSDLVKDAERASEFIESYVGVELRTGDTLQDLDSAFSVWLNSEFKGRFSDSDVVRIVGSSIGKKAVENLGVRWARVTDQHGSVIALVMDAPDIRSYPFTSVQYRIEDRETNFVSALYEVLKKAIEDRTREPS